MEIFETSVAIAKSEQLALSNALSLKIRPHEFLRYFCKAAHLAALYEGFSPLWSRKRAVAAGRAGFLSCVYDVASDLRHNKPGWRTIFKEILERETKNPQAATMAIEIYDKDCAGALEFDGLERGIIAFRFILSEMGLIDHFNGITSIDDLGLLLQIVDDVLDYEEDQETNDLNCLNSERAHDYLLRLITEMPDEKIRTLFPRSRLLLYIIRKARKKAEAILHAKKICPQTIAE